MAERSLCAWWRMPVICDVDIGNTLIKWRLDGSSKIEVSQGYAELIEVCRQAGVDVLRVCCVAPREKLIDLWQEVDGFGVALQEARVRRGWLGLDLAYRDIAALGVDRWLAMLAARDQFPGTDFVVLSAGTAVTADMVLSDGRHLGGLIVAGVQTSANALYSRTDGVGQPQIDLLENWQPGENTLNCVQGGYSALYQGFLHSVMDKAEALMQSPTIIMTGGDANLLHSLLASSIRAHVVPALVLDGLPLALP